MQKKNQQQEDGEAFVGCLVGVLFLILAISQCSSGSGNKAEDWPLCDSSISICSNQLSAHDIQELDAALNQDVNNTNSNDLDQAGAALDQNVNGTQNAASR